MSEKIIQGGSFDWDKLATFIPSGCGDARNFLGLLNLTPTITVPDIDEDPLSKEILDQMINAMRFGIDYPSSYSCCYMDEAKMPRFSKLRKFLFKNTIK